MFDNPAIDAGYATFAAIRNGDDWDRVVANCLQGSLFDLDEEAIGELLGIVADPERLSELMGAVESGAGENSESGGISACCGRPASA